MAVVNTNTNNYLSNGSSQSFVAGQVAGTAASFGRLLSAGLVPGAGGVLSDAAGKVLGAFGFQSADGTTLSAELDWRVRISMARYTAQFFYNGNNPLMKPLSVTSGVVFPYTPTIKITQTARYSQQQLTHANYIMHNYEGSEVGPIEISGEFTVQNQVEGQYLMAVIQFFRTITKMFTGNDLFAGSPPPMVFLDGYGPAYLPHVPCVVSSFSHTMPNEVDYIQVSLNGVAGNQLLRTTQSLDVAGGGASYGSTVRLPTFSTVSVTLLPMYSRKNIANNFTLDKFSKGALIEDGTSSIGGFI